MRDAPSSSLFPRGHNHEESESVSRAASVECGRVDRGRVRVDECPCTERPTERGRREILERTAWRGRRDSEPQHARRTTAAATGSTALPAGAPGVSGRAGLPEHCPGLSESGARVSIPRCLSRIGSGLSRFRTSVSHLGSRLSRFGPRVSGSAVSRRGFPAVSGDAGGRKRWGTRLSFAVIPGREGD